MSSLSSYSRADLVARVFQDPLAGTCADLTIAENLALAFSRGKKRSSGFNKIFERAISKITLNL